MKLAMSYEYGYYSEGWNSTQGADFGSYDFSDHDYGGAGTWEDGGGAWEETEPWGDATWANEEWGEDWAADDATATQDWESKGDWKGDWKGSTSQSSSAAASKDSRRWNVLVNTGNNGTAKAAEPPPTQSQCRSRAMAIEGEDGNSGRGAAADREHTVSRSPRRSRRDRPATPATASAAPPQRTAGGSCQGTSVTIHGAAPVAPAPVAPACAEVWRREAGQHPPQTWSGLSPTTAGLKSHLHGPGVGRPGTSGLEPLEPPPGIF